MSESPPERGPDEAYCRNCAAVISDSAEICPECGVRQRPPPQSSTDRVVENLLEGRNPFVAALASVVLPGLGQAYNREIGKAMAFFVGFLLAAVSVVVLIGFVLAPAVWLYSVYDAFVVAQRRAEEHEQERQQGGEEESESSTATGEVAG
jgi:TM2 domain-containing membrane protein YozV